MHLHLLSPGSRDCAARMDGFQQWWLCGCLLPHLQRVSSVTAVAADRAVCCTCPSFALTACLLVKPFSGYSRPSTMGNHMILDWNLRHSNPQLILRASFCVHCFSGIMLIIPFRLHPAHVFESLLCAKAVEALNEASRTVYRKERLDSLQRPVCI